MTKEYDLIIVGAGLFGATVARTCTDSGLKCLVLEKRNNPGGNCMDEYMEGINVHLYGPHIFLTTNEYVWEFVNRFSEFNHFRYSPLASYKGRLYNLPFNLHTFYQLYGITNPEDAKEFMSIEQKKYQIKTPLNLEEKAISLVGRKMYETLIKGYTEKQWGKPCHELPPYIISRLPVRTTFDNNYFNDPYQGIPKEGYTQMIRKMLLGIEVIYGVDYLEERKKWDSKGRKIIYTGAIDHFFDYSFGTLDYRSLRWKIKLYEKPDVQGVAVINYTDVEIPMIRTIEHKHFVFGNQQHTIISEEYPQPWHKGLQPFYPINDSRNNTLYKKYVSMAESRCPNVIFGGRLGLYEYLDMDKTILKAMVTADKLILDLKTAYE